MVEVDPSSSWQQATQVVDAWAAGDRTSARDGMLALVIDAQQSEQGRRTDNDKNSDSLNALSWIVMCCGFAKVRSLGAAVFAPSEVDVIEADTLGELPGALVRFENRASFDVWVRGIAMNMARSYVKSQKKHKTDGLAVTTDADERAAEASLRMSSEVTNEQTLDWALGQLNPKDQEVLLLYGEYGNFPDVARVLQLPRKTVTSQVKRAAVRLRAIVENPETIKRWNQSDD